MITDEMVNRAIDAYNEVDGGVALFPGAIRAILEAALAAAEPVKVRNDDVGFVDFLNADRPYICRKTEGACYLLIDRETGDVVGYRKYDDETIDTPAPSVAVSQTLIDLATAVLAQAPTTATEFMNICLDDIRSAISGHAGTLPDVGNWTDDKRAKAWRRAFDTMHRRAMKAEAALSAAPAKQED